MKLKFLKMKKDGRLIKIGESLHTFRLLKRLNRKKVFEGTGISEPSIMRIEKGNNFSIKLMFILLDFYGKTIHDLDI